MRRAFTGIEAWEETRDLTSRIEVVGSWSLSVTSRGGLRFDFRESVKVGAEPGGVVFWRLANGGPGLLGRMNCEAVSLRFERIGRGRYV